MVQATLAEGQAACEPDVDAFSRVGDGVVQHAGIRPFGGAVAGFFGQLAGGAFQHRLADLQLAGGKLEHHVTERVAELALDDQPAIVEQRHDHHRTGVHDVFARGGVAGRQAHLVAAHMQQLAVEHRLGAQLLLAQVRVARLCTAHAWCRLR